MAVIIKPLTTLDIISKVPTGTEYLTKLKNILLSITQLSDDDISLDTEVNLVTEEPDYQHVYVLMPSRDYVELVYHAQPLMGCLIVHKLAHIEITPFMRYSKK